jgi:hypothetical protein
MYLNPSLDNPIGLTGTPLLSLPWKAISHFMGPSNSLFSSSMDQVINGELGAGREWYEQLLPVHGQPDHRGTSSRTGARSSAQAVIRRWRT